MASISPTTSLATFQTSHASSSKLRPHVRLSEVRNSNQQLGVLTVRGDGVWTYDVSPVVTPGVSGGYSAPEEVANEKLSTPRPTTSFTVPPSTVFAGPAISYIPWISQSDREKEKQRAMDGDEPMESAEMPPRERVTAVVISKGEGVKKSDEGRVVWAWRGEEGEKQAIHVRSPYPLSVAHADGEIDGSPIQHLIHLERQSGLLAVQSPSKIKYIDESFAIREIASPLTSSSGRSILTADFLNIKGDWRLIMVDAKGRVMISKLDFQVCELEVLHDGHLCSENVELVNAEISADGGVTAISSKHEIISVDYKDLRNTLSAPFPVLTSPSTTPILPLAYPSKPIALIPSLSTTSIALAVTSQQSPAVLTTLPILLGADNTSTIADIQVISRTSPFSWVIGFAITHKHAQGDSGRTIVYTAEVALPEKGIGLNVLLGSQERSKQLFRMPSSSKGNHGETDGADRLLESIAKALAESGGSVEARAAQGERLWSARDRAQTLSESKIKALVNVVFDAAIPKTSANGSTDGEVAESTKPKRTGPYAKRIISDLLGQGLLSDTMLPGGLILAGLLPCGDWDLIPRAIDSLPTVSSASVISCLVASLHPPSPPTTPTPPPFDDLYAQILRLPPPPPTWRVEMRQRVSVEDATVVLETLLAWAEEHVASQSTLATWDAAPADPDASLPPLPAVLQHASLLLDSHIALFLSHPPSHAALEKLQTAIAPLLAAQNDYRALRAPIEALLTLANRAARDRDESAARREAQKPEDRKRRGRDAKGGVVELRTEVIGKWRVEDFAF